MKIHLINKHNEVVRVLTFADSTPLYGVIVDPNGKDGETSYTPNPASLKGNIINYHEVDSYLLD